MGGVAETGRSAGKIGAAGTDWGRLTESSTLELGIEGILTAGGGHVWKGLKWAGGEAIGWPAGHADEAADAGRAVATASAPGAQVIIGGVKATELPGRLSTEIMQTIQKHTGLEAAQIYVTGPGKNGGGGVHYLLHGSASSVPIPIGSNIRLINHTHPAFLNGLPVPLQRSVDDIDVLIRLHAAGSPQVTSQTVPEIGQPFIFSRK